MRATMLFSRSRIVFLEYDEMSNNNRNRVTSSLWWFNPIKSRPNGIITTGRSLPARSPYQITAPSLLHSGGNLSRSSFTKYANPAILLRSNTTSISLIHQPNASFVDLLMLWTSIYSASVAHVGSSGSPYSSLSVCGYWTTAGRV